MPTEIVNKTNKKTNKKSSWREKIGKLKYEIKQNKAAYLFFAPFGILFFVFVVFPVLISIVLSFTSFNMLQMPKWVGWKNYIRLFLADDVFLIAIKNTLVFSIVTGPLSYFL